MLHVTGGVKWEGYGRRSFRKNVDCGSVLLLVASSVADALACCGCVEWWWLAAAGASLVWAAALSSPGCLPSGWAASALACAFAILSWCFCFASVSSLLPGAGSPLLLAVRCGVASGGGCLKLGGGGG